MEHGCFFIFDNYAEDEKVLDELILLYFHPEDTPLAGKLYLQGACAAMVPFVQIFTNKPIQIAYFKHTKMAFKTFPGPITMVLPRLTPQKSCPTLASAGAHGAWLQVLTSNAVGEEDATLMYQLETLYKAFRFYNGSIADVMVVEALAIPALSFWSKPLNRSLPLANSNTGSALARISSSSSGKWDRF